MMTYVLAVMVMVIAPGPLSAWLRGASRSEVR
jgi:hypothetical protein